VIEIKTIRNFSNGNGCQEAIKLPCIVCVKFGKDKQVRQGIA
jgi:hypothetical protein